jgi:hypothetical protein
MEAAKVPSVMASVDNLYEKSASFNFTQSSIIKEIQCLNLKIIIKCHSPTLSEYDSYLKNISTLSLKDLPSIKSAERGFLSNLCGVEDYNIYLKYEEKSFTDFNAFQEFIPSLKPLIVSRSEDKIYFRNLPWMFAQIQDQK